MNTTYQSEAAKLKDRDYSRKEVVNIIRTVLGSIDKDSDESVKLYNELSTIVTYIDNMRMEMAQLRSSEINESHIPAASDELDAVVIETAAATGTIMDACEKIEKIANGLDASTKEELANAVTSVYEACAFQDITGQRITKVVKTLKHIETKVSEIIDAFGHHGQATAPMISEKDKEGLLNGPQLKSLASSQEEIDKLLASFD